MAITFNGQEYLSKTELAARCGISETALTTALSALGIVPTLLAGDMRRYWYAASEVARIRAYYESVRGVRLP